MKYLVTHVFVVRSWMVFGDIVGEFVAFSRDPENCELTLFDSVADPVKSHVNGFGAFVFDGAVGESDGS